VERKNGADTFELVAVLPADTTSQTAWSLTPETTSTFRVNANNIAGYLPYTEGIQATALPPTGPRPNELFILIDDPGRRRSCAAGKRPSGFHIRGFFLKAAKEPHFTSHAACSGGDKDNCITIWSNKVPVAGFDRPDPGY
jgi:hypothetical protein